VYKAGKKITLIIITLCVCLVFIAGCAGSPSSEEPKSPQPPANNADAINPEPNNPEPEGENQRQLVSEIVRQAEQGKVPGCQYVAGTTVFDQVEKEWGKPNRADYVAAAKGTYYSYTSRGFVLGINKGMQIFEVRAMAQGTDLAKVTVADVQKVLGPPDKMLKYPGQDILGYAIGTKYKLEFVFPETGVNNEAPALDHVNVLYPKGTINMMADDPGREW
jgi:hypothetical protein